MDPTLSIRSLLRVLKTTIHDRLQLEPENDPSVVPEVALVIITLGKAVSKTSQNKIKLRWPDGDGFAQWNVNSSANNKIPSIVARICGSGAGACTGFEQILISIGMGSAKKRLYEGLEVLRPIFHDRTPLYVNRLPLAFTVHPMGQGLLEVAGKTKVLLKLA
jgi:hypothetical protein